MSDAERHDLQKTGAEQHLPIGFEDLSEEDKRDVLRKIQDKQIDVNEELARKVNQSRVAERDLQVHSEEIERMDHDRKIYSSKVSAETGSGKIEMQVRGGDTRFIVPIIVVIGVVILAIIAIVALR